MKRRIIAIVAVVAVLSTLFCTAVSAVVQDSAKDFFTWSYKYLEYINGTNSSNVGGVYETMADSEFYFATWYDLINYNTDEASRNYANQFLEVERDNGDVNTNRPIMNSAHYQQLDMDDTMTHYREGFINFGYKYTLPCIVDDFKPNGRDVYQYDPYTDFTYTNFTVYHYFKFTQEDSTTAGVSMHIEQNELSDVQYNTYSYEFNRVGEWQVITNIVFFNNDTIEYDNIETVTTIFVQSESIDEDLAYQRGYNDGYNEGYHIGYNKGYYDGIATEEKWTVLSLINAIIEAPFTFIDNAFSFTVFGVNVANAIRVVFTIGIIAMLAVVIFKVFI